MFPDRGIQVLHRTMTMLARVWRKWFRQGGGWRCYVRSAAASPAPAGMSVLAAGPGQVVVPGLDAVAREGPRRRLRQPGHRAPDDRTGRVHVFRPTPVAESSIEVAMLTLAAGEHKRPLPLPSTHDPVHPS
ncbi:hypothetical protein ACFWCR_26125 [Streptomyces goshikiensis]|uniref:hypothetical protein n=1 Tax=Streptomyces goshikiensis TaxID=1942 RepID=UPI00367D1397